MKHFAPILKTAALSAALLAGLTAITCSNDPVFAALEKEEKTVDKGLDNNMGILAVDMSFKGKMWVAGGQLYSRSNDSSNNWSTKSLPNIGSNPAWCYDVAVDEDNQILYIAVMDYTDNEDHYVYKTEPGSGWQKVMDGNSGFRLFSNNNGTEDEVQIAKGSTVWNYTNAATSSTLGSPDDTVKAVVHGGDDATDYIIAYGDDIEDLYTTTTDFTRNFSDDTVEHLFFHDGTLYAGLSDDTIRSSSNGSDWVKASADYMIAGIGTDGTDVYAGLNAYGLKRISGSNLRSPPGDDNYSVSDLSSASAITFFTDADGDFFVGTLGKGLWKLDGSEWSRE